MIKVLKSLYYLSSTSFERPKEAKVAGYALPGERVCFGKTCATPGISDAGNNGYLRFVLLRY